MTTQPKLSGQEIPRILVCIKFCGSNLTLVQLCQRSSTGVNALFDSHGTHKDSLAISFLSEVIFGTAPVPIPQPFTKLHSMPSERSIALTRLFSVATFVSDLRSPPSEVDLRNRTDRHSMPAAFHPRAVPCSVTLILSVPISEGSAGTTSAFSDMLRFVCLHFPLLERHLAVVAAEVGTLLATAHSTARLPLQHDGRVGAAVKACEQAVLSLVHAPRLPMHLHFNRSAAAADQFVNSLQALDVLDTATTNLYVALLFAFVIQVC